MICSHCQRENRGDARFCDGCGQTLPLGCDGCGRVLRGGALFCDACGRPVEGGPPASPAPESESDDRAPSVYTPAHLADRILHQRSAIEGERKLVTVLFADVDDSTPLFESMDAEAVHSLMDRAFQRILDAVHRYEGTVNQFLGDGVMALFGAPLAIEDAPRRAVLAARAIQNSLADLDEETRGNHQHPFQMRIGLHSGPVVVGRIGDDLRMDYTAVGDTTHLADRLQGRARPGEILVSDATKSGVEDFFDLEDLGVAPAKGFPEPVRAWRVVAERQVGSRIEARAASGLTCFVGRDSELAALDHALANTREGRGQVVVISGDAGIGKSRLLYEFQSGLSEEPHVWLEGRCSAVRGTTAFLAVSDSLRRYFRIEDQDDETKASDRVDAGVVELGDDLRWTLPYLRALLSLPSLDPAVDELESLERRSETVRALQALLMRLAERAPLIYAVEDLHWIDPASEELLMWLVDAVPTARILMLLTCRPGYQPPFGDRTYLLRLSVQPLSAESMSTMAGSLVESESVPSELLRLVSDKAEGNPFFVEEILKSLVEEGILAVVDGRVELQREVAGISVPDSIHDVLMARLDRLEDEPKRAIQVASVIGREFALRLLVAIREAGDDVQQVVGELRSLELIYEKVAHPELAFMFKHALTHDVAYESILNVRRKALHRLVGVAIEELYSDRLAEHYEALAHHFERAEEWSRALHYHESAALLAREKYANRGAIEHFERALALVDRAEPSLSREHLASLHEGLASALGTVSELEQACYAFRQAASFCDEGPRRARNLARATNTATWAHLWETIDPLAEETTQVARTCNDTGSEAIASVSLGMRDLVLEGPAAVGDQFLESVALAERSGDAEALIQTGSLRSLILEMRGDFTSAIEVARAAVEVGAEMRANSETGIAQWILCLGLGGIGHYGQAIELLRSGIETCERIGDRAVRARLLNTAGWLQSEIGADELARDFNGESVTHARYLIDRGDVEAAPEVHANAVVNLANNWTALGEPSRARDVVDPIAASMDNADHDPFNVWRYRLHVKHSLARIALVRGEPDVALTHLDAEFAGARAQGLRKIEARSIELRARALVSMGQPDEALPLIEEARRIAAGIGYPPVQWRCDSLALELARREGARAAAERFEGSIRARIAGHLDELRDPTLRRYLTDLGEQLVATPLSAHR